MTAQLFGYSRAVIKRQVNGCKLDPVLKKMWLDELEVATKAKQALVVWDYEPDEAKPRFCCLGVFGNVCGLATDIDSFLNDHSILPVILLQQGVQDILIKLNDNNDDWDLVKRFIRAYL